MKKLFYFIMNYFLPSGLALFLIFCNQAFAQSGTIDATFIPIDQGFSYGTGVNNQVFSSAVQSDGKIVIGGSFSSYNGTSRNGIARINTDGTLDTSFHVGAGLSSPADIHPKSIALQSDGKIIIGGYFTWYNGTVINRIARLNTDGSLDTTFVVGTGANGVVNTVAIQSDGKIIIGGYFTSVCRQDKLDNIGLHLMECFS